MESGNSNVEALQREIFALDDLYVEYAEYQKKYANLYMKYQGALNTLRRTREALVDVERLVNQYKDSSVTLDEYQAITDKLEALQIEYNLLRDEYNNFVNTAELRYQNSCKEFNDKIQALEGSDTQKCQQQKAGPGRPRGRPSNSAKFQKICDELNAAQATLKAQRDGWQAKCVNLELQNADILNRHDSLLCEVNTLKGQLQERDDKLRCMQLGSSSAEIQIKKLEKEIECFKQPCELESPGALHEQADELCSEECSVAKSVNLELQNADILNRHDSLLCEVNTLKGQLQERDDKLRCMQLGSSSAEIQIKELEKEIECFKQRCELESPGALHEQADELFSEGCANKDAIVIQEKIGYEVTPVSSDIDEDLYNDAIEDGRSFQVLSLIPRLSPLRFTPEPESDGSIVQHNEDLSEVIPRDGSVQTQNDYVFSSPAPVNRLVHCAMYTQTDDLKKYCTTSTQTRLRDAPLRVNRLSEKITKVRKNIPRKRVNCGTINHMFNCKFCMSTFTRKVIAVNRNRYIIKQPDGTKLLIEKMTKGTKKTKDDITTKAEKASVGTIKNSEEVDLSREIVEPRSVDSGYIRTDTDGENDCSITVDKQSIPANESALKDKPGSIKKKCQRYVNCAKRKREIRKRKAKCRNCANNLESDDEFSTTSSLTDYSDSPKRMEKASNALPSAAESNENRHNKQTVEQTSSTDVSAKGSLESGVLDLSVSKNKSSTALSITSKESEVLDLSVSKHTSSAPSFITHRESEILDLSVSKKKPSAPSSVVNMITNNHINHINDFCTIVSAPNVTVDRNMITNNHINDFCTIVSAPNVTVDRNGEQIQINISIPNKMERPNNAIINISDYSYVSNPKDSKSKNQGSTSSSPSETRYEPPQNQLDNCSMDENQQSTPLPSKVSDYKAHVRDEPFGYSSLSSSTPNSIKSCNKRKIKGSWCSNTSYLNEPGVEIYTAPKSRSLENSKESTTVDNCDFIVPLCSEVTGGDSSNPRTDKLKVLELFGTDSELDTSFQSVIDVSQSPKVKKKCRKVRKNSKKIPKKSLAVEATLGFDDKNYIVTRSRKRNAIAAQKSALVTTLKTNTGEKSNAGVSNQTLVSKKRAAVANKKLENGSVMKTRSATRKAGIVKVHDRLMSCILTSCKSHGDQEGSSNCVRKFNSYVADVEDSLRIREAFSAKSIETGRNEDSAPYHGKKRIAHMAKHNNMSKSANSKAEMVQQTNELSKSLIVVCARLDNHRLENKNVNGIQALNQELSECSGVINGGELVPCIPKLDLTKIKELTKLRTTDDNSTTDDLKYGANHNSANIKSPESSSRNSGGDIADNNGEYCKDQSSNIFRILKTAADQKEALVKSGRISERPLETDSKRRHLVKRMKSPNSIEVDLLSPAPPHNPRSALGQLESDSQKEQPSKRMKLPNRRNVDLPRPEPPHNKRSALGRLENDSKKTHSIKGMKSPNSGNVDLPRLESPQNKRSPNSRDVDLPSPEPSSSHDALSTVGQLERDSQKLELGKRMKSPNSKDVDLPSPESTSHNARSALEQLENDSKKAHPIKRMKSPNSGKVNLPRLKPPQNKRSPSRDGDLPSPEPSSHNARSTVGQLEKDSQKLELGKRMKSPNNKDVDLPSPEPTSHNARSVLGQLENDSKKVHPIKRMKSPNSGKVDLPRLKPPQNKRSPNRDVDLPSPEPTSSHNARSTVRQLKSDSQKLLLGKRIKSPNSKNVDLPSPEPTSSHNARSTMGQLKSDSQKLLLGKRIKSPNSKNVDLPSPEPTSSHNARSTMGQWESYSQKLHPGERMKSPNSRDVDLPSPEPPPYKTWSSLGSPRRSSRIIDGESSITTEQILNRQKAAEQLASSRANSGTEQMSFKRPLCKKRSRPLQSPASPEHPTEDVEPVAPKIIPLERIYGSPVVLREKPKPEVKQTVPRKAPKMSQGKAKMLLQQMLQFHEDENIKAAVRSFVGHSPTFIVKLVLEQAVTDQREELAKRKGATEPILTIPQQALLKLMIGLDNLGGGQVCRTFLDTVDELLPTINNPAHLCPITRLYVALCKRSLDFWRIRKALCISFALMGDLAVPFMYIILQSWLEVMPTKESVVHGSLYVKAIVQLVLLKNCAHPVHLYANLHQLLKCYYGYSVEPLNSKELLLEMFRNFIVEGNECLVILSMALSNGLDKKWVFQQIDTEIKPQINAAPTNVDQVCTIVKLVGYMTMYHYETLDPSVIESNRQWLEKCCDTPFPDCVRDRATSVLKVLPKSVNN